MKTLLTILSFALIASMIISSSTSSDDDILQNKNAKLDMLELLSQYGYPGEKYTVATQDGYLLTVYRIPYGVKCGKYEKRKLPVLLMHGVLLSSIDFINYGPEKGLGFILADHCYDVWLGNSRGNTESRNHLTLDPNHSEFWQFSWHELGQYDLPAIIAHILDITRQRQIHYIGQSQGSTEFFVYASLYPEESARIVRTMHALGPIAYQGNVTSPLMRTIADHLNKVEELTDIIGWDEYLPKSSILSDVFATACREQHLNEMCANIIFLLSGYDSVRFDKAMISVIASSTPAGTSTKTLIHYAQEEKSNEFRQYDYGQEENFKRYRTAEPPSYEINKIRTPLYLYYGENDWLSTPLDVERFAYEVSDVVKVKMLLPEFNHLDFFWAIDVRTVLYDPLIGYLDNSEVYNRLENSRPWFPLEQLASIISLSWRSMTRFAYDMLFSLNGHLENLYTDVY